MLKKRTIQISSSLTELYKIEEFVEQISDVYNINNNYYSTILISLDEAVRNAIEHGNNFDKQKKVEIAFTTAKGELIFSVSDQGNGFDASSIVDPTDPLINQDLDAGKGLFLMEQLSDNMTFSSLGNTVSLHFKVSSINKELSVLRSTALQSYFQETKQTISV
ncbi:MAG: ATP-binding protein [Bacteroidales bacterium]|nr:ATP-binding protein [Bacteroidales bacterium]